MQGDRPFVIAGNAIALDKLCGAISLQLGQVRVLRDEKQLEGHFNCMLYVGRDADAALVEKAKNRGFTINEVRT
jgi:hypothetical protein